MSMEEIADHVVSVGASRRFRRIAKRSMPKFGKGTWVSQFKNFEKFAEFLTLCLTDDGR